MAKDKVYKELIAKSRWLRLRKWKLTKNPLCERCLAEGRVKEAEEVHHVTPVEDGLTRAEKAALMYDPHNLQSLCADCHIKTHTEIGRSGKANAKRRTKQQLKRFCEKFLFLQFFAQMLKGGGFF